jgi:hypothetical protein
MASGSCFTTYPTHQAKRPPEGGLCAERPRAGLGAPECDGACDGSRPGPYGVAIVTALNDPLTVFLADNFPDVVAPHHDGADLGTARV